MGSDGVGEWGRWGGGAGTGFGEVKGEEDVSPEHNKMFVELFNTSASTYTSCILVQPSTVL